MGAHHCKVAGASKVFRKRKPTTSRRQSQTQAEKRFKEGEHNGFSDVDIFSFLNVKVRRFLKTRMDYCEDLARS